MFSSYFGMGVDNPTGHIARDGTGYLNMALFAILVPELVARWLSHSKPSRFTISMPGLTLASLQERPPVFRCRYFPYRTRRGNIRTGFR